MKIFRWFLIAVLAGAIIALDWYLDKPLHLQYGAWRESFSALRVVMSLVIFVIALQLFIKLCAAVLFMPSRVSRWRRAREEKRMRDSLAEGVRALAVEDNKQAFKSFSHLAQNDSSGAFSWLAARAAEKQGDRAKRDEWLRRASVDSSKDIAAAAKAKLAREENRLSEAFSILSAAGAPYGSPLLANIYLEIARQRKQWPQALAAAYRLMAHGNSPAQTKIAGEIARGGLAEIAELDALRDFWKTNISDEDRKKPALVAEYIYALERLGDGKGAREYLERAAKAAAAAPAIIAAVADLGGQELRENAFTRGQKNADEKNPDYLAAMGALAERLELWGKARRYYQMANALRPERRYVQALAELEEKMQTENANTENAADFPRP